MNTKTTPEGCRCDMRTKLLGDGCEFCNPKLVAEIDNEVEMSTKITPEEMQALRAAGNYHALTLNILDMVDLLSEQAAEIERLRASPVTLDPDAVFRPYWPQSLKSEEGFRIFCDDKGRNKGTWLDVFLANDGDVHVSMQDWEDVPNGEPSPFPSLRVRSLSGGGRNLRTRQALLWLAEAMRLDAAADALPEPNQQSNVINGAIATCKICKGTGWNYGAQPGPGPGYRTVKCRCFGARPR